MIKKECLFNTSFTTKEELFKGATEFLIHNGNVSNEFEEALNVREKQFPTGLPTVPSVAIPHTDGTFVLNDTILCIVNKTELVFNEMGGDEEDTVFPRVIFMLALSEGEVHLDQLQNLVTKIQEGVLIEKVLKVKNSAEFESVVNTYL